MGGYNGVCGRVQLKSCVHHLIIIISAFLYPISTWQDLLSPKSVVHLNYSGSKDVQVFGVNDTSSDHLRLLQFERNNILVGGRNALYNISLEGLKENYKLIWESKSLHIDLCLLKQKSEAECQNYIRVFSQMKNNSLIVCGTNAFNPRCRLYQNNFNEKLSEQTGVGICPLDPKLNHTFTYSDGLMYTGLATDFQTRSFIIHRSNLGSSYLITDHFNSAVLNQPQFVKSFTYGDKVYFFFREMAIEHINCEKVIFPRVARVCKNDLGNPNVLSNTFTSFFKARLNCSVPGEFPFYFNELQHVSDIGQGNYMSTHSSGNRSDVIYAVLNTPQNSIRGSAICVFSMRDILASFMGEFKGQTAHNSQWLPVSPPNPHPAECSANSQNIDASTLSFIKVHPFMEKAVPSAGGAPVFIQTGNKYRFTTVAVDWQVFACDNRYYDIIFIGTDNGHVLKTINKGQGSKIENVLIEDIHVLPNGDPVTQLYVHRKMEFAIEKLVVVSYKKILTVPLHRCNDQKTCKDCVALQDPYCSWSLVDQRCSNSNKGIQAIQNGGKHSQCGNTDDVTTPSMSTTNQTTMPPPTCLPCTTVNVTVTSPPTNGTTVGISPKRPRNSSSETTRAPEGISPRAVYGIYTVRTIGVALSVSILLSLCVGFTVGFLFKSYLIKKMSKDLITVKKANFPEVCNNLNTDVTGKSPNEKVDKKVTNSLNLKSNADIISMTDEKTTENGKMTYF